MNNRGKHSGIVLRRIGPNKIAVLDVTLGRIDGVLHTCAVSTGALLSYNIKSYGYGMYGLTGLMLEQLPLYLARIDVLFLHHVLEMCYFFIPVHSVVPDVFSLITRLYDDNCRYYYSAIYKKLFVCKLFAAMGIHPELAPDQQIYLHKILAMPIDMINDTTVDLENGQLLDEWLCGCIAQHPKMEHFNTIHFLTKNRLL